MNPMLVRCRAISVLGGMALSGGLLSTALPAWAGDLAAVPTMMAPIYMNTTIGLGMINAARDSIHADDAAADPTSAPTPLVPADPSAFSVGADPAVSAQMQAQFLDGIRANSSPDAAASIAATFQRKPVRSAYLEAARPYGLSDRDLRDVTAAYLVTGWMIVNQAPLPTVAQVRGVRDQVAAGLQRTPPAGDDRARQMTAEQMMYQLVSLIYARQEGEQAHNSQGLQQMADQTAAAFQKQNFDLRSMDFTDHGFAAR